MHVEIPTSTGSATAELDRPRGRTPTGLLVLTHGAGGGVDTPDLLAVRTAATQAGWAVARVLQPYRFANRRVPSAPAKQDAGWVDLVGFLRAKQGLGDGPLVVGGRSNGARVACRTATTTGAAGVVALAFPLHPPGKPESTRIAELDGAGVAVLVVQGERDPFGRPPPGPDREVIVVRGDHALKADPGAVATAVVDWLARFTRR